MKNYPWWNPVVGEAERRLVNEVFDSNFLNDGDFTLQFEKRIADLAGARHVVAVTSGTSALYLSLMAVGVGPGTEVIVPDVTFIATANAVSMTGAKVVLVDVEPTDLNIDPQAILKAITPRTKAIVPVHVSGKAADMTSILKIAREHGLHVIEDAAEALKSHYQGKSLGTLGDAGCLSFSPNKTITTGQGGAILTNDDKIYARLRELKDQGRPVRGTGGDDVHHSIGFNFKFTNLQAAVGLGQLNYLESRVERQKSINKIYGINLEKTQGITIQKFDFEQGEVPQWTMGFIDRRDALDDFLKTKGAHCRRFWFPLHTQSPYRQPDDLFPVSTRQIPKSLWLPSSFTLTDRDVLEICGYIKEFLR